MKIISMKPARRFLVSFALALMLAAMPAMSMAAASNSEEDPCAAAATPLALAFGVAEEYSGVPAPQLPAPSCEPFAHVCDENKCVVSKPGTYYAPGDLDLQGSLDLVGEGTFVLLVEDALTISGVVSTVAPSGFSLSPADGPSLVLLARSIHVKDGAVVSAADGSAGVTFIAQGTDLAARGVPGGNGGSIILIGDTVNVDGVLAPGDGGHGGAGIGLAGADAYGGAGGAAGYARIITPHEDRAVAGGIGGDGGFAYSAILPSDAFVVPCVDACIHPPSSMADVACFGAACLVPLNVDTGPVGKLERDIDGIQLPSVPQSPDEVTRALCALVRDCTIPNPPPVGDPGQTVGGLVQLVSGYVPDGPYCAAGRCLDPQDPTVPGEIPDTGEVVQKVVGLIPPGPYCVPAWGFCLQWPEQPTIPPPIPTIPPLPKPSPCLVLAACMFWEDVTNGVTVPDYGPVLPILSGAQDCRKSSATGANGGTSLYIGGQGGDAVLDHTGCTANKGRDGTNGTPTQCTGGNGYQGAEGAGGTAQGGNGGAGGVRGGDGGNAKAQGGTGGPGGRGGNGFISIGLICEGGDGGQGGPGGSVTAEGGDGGDGNCGAGHGGTAAAGAGAGGAGGAGGLPQGETGPTGIAGRKTENAGNPGHQSVECSLPTG